MKKRLDRTNFPKKNDSPQETESSAVGCGCCSTRHPRFDKFFGDFVDESTAHGIKYTGAKKLHPTERIFWIIVMLTSLGVSIFLANNVFTKYYKNPVIISFQAKETVVSQIPFPAITICSVNLLKASVLNDTYGRLSQLFNDAKRGVKLEPDQLAKMYKDAGHLDHLSQFCLTAPSFRRELNETLLDANGYPDFVNLIDMYLSELNDSDTEKVQQAEHNNPNYWTEERDIFQEATISCEEMLLGCMWAGEVMPCKELFFHVNTRHGRCCVFNMMPKFLLQNISEDEGRAKREMADVSNDTINQWKKFGKGNLIKENAHEVDDLVYPKYQKAGGRQYGLTVLTNPNLEEYSTCTASDGSGFKIVAHSPLSTPSIMDYGAAVPANHEVFIDIEPEVTVVEDEETLMAIDLDKRGCLLNHEQASKLEQYNFYSPENCFSECWAEYTFKICACVRYFMPRNATQELCGAKKRVCANEVRVNLTKTFGKNSFCGHCEAPCTEILYKLQTSFFDVREDLNLEHFAFNNSEGNTTYATNYSIIHIYMGADSFNAKQRKRLFTLFDLIANAGGLLSLTLGVSIISFIEVGYFFTIRAWIIFRPSSKENNIKKDDKVGSNTTTRTHSMITRSRTTMMMDKRDEYYNWAFINKFGVTGNSSAPVAGNNNGKGLAGLPEPQSNATKSYFGLWI